MTERAGVEGRHRTGGILHMLSCNWSRQTTSKLPVSFKSHLPETSKLDIIICIARPRFHTFATYIIIAPWQQPGKVGLYPVASTYVVRCCKHVCSDVASTYSGYLVRENKRDCVKCIPSMTGVYTKQSDLLLLPCFHFFGFLQDTKNLASTWTTRDGFFVLPTKHETPLAGCPLPQTAQTTHEAPRGNGVHSWQWHAYCQQSLAGSSLTSCMWRVFLPSPRWSGRLLEADEWRAAGGSASDWSDAARKGPWCSSEWSGCLGEGVRVISHSWWGKLHAS